MSIKDIFTGIFASNGWGGRESVSGSGSDKVETRRIVESIQGVLDKYDIKSIVDAPCGDVNWVFDALTGYSKDSYIGVDIVEELIEQNKEKHPGVRFEVLDICSERLPSGDLVLARDILGHLGADDRAAAVKNIKESGAKYVLTTHFPEATNDKYPDTGGWEPINADMLFGDHIELLEEDHPGKYLALYEL